MADWRDVLLEPADLKGQEDLRPWFDRIAEVLLNGCRLMVADQPHRFTEVEFYYHGGKHLDVFTHRDPIQREIGRWYFHRTRGEYRGGSFKGFDLTFGDTSVFGGVLIRGLEKPDGSLVDGPSLSVDHLLATTEAGSVADLDEAIEARPAWDEGSPLQLVFADDLEQKPVLKTARVGLTLKRHKPAAEGPPKYVMRPYRYVSEPRRISKGKPHMVVALHLRGLDAEAIREQTGCTRRSVEGYIADFEEGKEAADFAPFYGKDLSAGDFCRMHGVWHAKWGG